MWSDTPEGRQFIEEISRNVVGEVAAEELELFPELAAEYFADPRAAGRQPDKDDALGFGLEAVVALTPAILAMTKVLLNFAQSELLEAAKTESASLIKEKVKAVFASLLTAEKESPAPLTRDQLKRIKKLAANEAVAFGVKPADAEKMSLALIGSLALAK